MGSLVEQLNNASGELDRTGENTLRNVNRILGGQAMLEKRVAQIIGARGEARNPMHLYNGPLGSVLLPSRQCGCAGSTDGKYPFRRCT
jgi:hypothetical protein